MKSVSIISIKAELQEGIIEALKSKKYNKKDTVTCISNLLEGVLMESGWSRKESKFLLKLYNDSIYTRGKNERN